MSARQAMQSDYMHWAKTRSAAKYNLALSDILHLPLSALPLEPSRLSVTAPGGYGYPPLLEAIGTAYDVPPRSVVTSFGTSMANHLAMAALISPGDEVLVEQPTYELILSTARFLGAKVRRFQRRPENDFQIDTDELGEAATAATTLIILTNLHNPSSAFTDEATLRRIGGIASKIGARVLVDEVYLDAAFTKDPRTAFHLGPQFVITNSLTKVFGLSGLRCGWIVAEPPLAERMWRLTDLFYGSPVHVAEQISVAAFSRRRELLQRAKTLLSANTETLNAFLATRTDLRSAPHVDGLVAFPGVVSADVERLCTLLREKFQTSVVPGRFFEMPRHIRIGVGRENETLREGLARLGRALDELAAGTG